MLFELFYLHYAGGFSFRVEVRHAEFPHDIPLVVLNNTAVHQEVKDARNLVVAVASAECTVEEPERHLYGNVEALQVPAGEGYVVSRHDVPFRVRLRREGTPRTPVDDTGVLLAWGLEWQINNHVLNNTLGKKKAPLRELGFF